jgi:nicotinamide-nucleotide amidase
MAQGVRRLLGADVGLAVTGVAGPDPQEDQPVGTLFLGLAMGDEIETTGLSLTGDRTRIRQFATISLVDKLRHRLLAGG